MLTPRFPWPPDDGGRVVLRQNLLAMARDFRTVLISFVPPGRSPSLPAEAIRAGIELVAVPFTPAPLVVSAIRGLFGRWPYTLARYRSRAYARAVRAAVTRERPSLAYVHHLHLATYVDALGEVPMVLREQNLEFRWMGRYARTAGASARGAYAAIQSARLRRAEAELCRRASLVLAIQDGEARALRGLAPGTRVETLPVGVDLPSSPPSPSSPPIVLLAASFAWAPNAEGAVRFLREGWPRLRARVPAVRLRVAGKAPPAALRAACADAGAELAADVPSMAEEYARATLLLVPVWTGAGARVKIIEALAAWLPVVATAAAADGLDLEPGVHYEAGETSAALADAAAELLGAPGRLQALAAAGREVAARRWSSEAVAATQAGYLASVVAGARPGDPRP
jgi:glycosyltransferase involved in cell wall biosynthesis